MKIKLILLVVITSLLCGCGGVVQDHYNPAIVGATFKGPVTVALVENIQIEQEKCVQQGYKVVGTCAFAGEYPETGQLISQAKRVHANHVIYSARAVPAQPGSWGFSFGQGFGSGGTGSGHTDVQIVFLGK